MTIPAPMRELAVGAALKAPACAHAGGNGTCVPCLVDAALTAALELCSTWWSWTWWGDDDPDGGWETLSEAEARHEASPFTDAVVVYRYRTPWYAVDESR